MNNKIENKVADDRSWEKIIMKYNRPDLRKSIWQIVNSFVPYVVMWYLMIQSLQYSYLADTLTGPDLIRFSDPVIHYIP